MLKRIIWRMRKRRCRRGVHENVEDGFVYPDYLDDVFIMKNITRYQRLLK